MDPGDVGTRWETLDVEVFLLPTAAVRSYCHFNVLAREHSIGCAGMLIKGLSSSLCRAKLIMTYCNVYTSLGTHASSVRESSQTYLGSAGVVDPNQPLESQRVSYFVSVWLDPRTQEARIPRWTRLTDYGKRQFVLKYW